MNSMICIGKALSANLRNMKISHKFFTKTDEKKRKKKINLKCMRRCSNVFIVKLENEKTESERVQGIETYKFIQREFPFFSKCSFSLL